MYSIVFPIDADYPENTMLINLNATSRHRILQNTIKSIKIPLNKAESMRLIWDSL
jgi:hypothetical protein